MQHVIGPHTFPLFLHVDLDNLSAAGASYAGRSGSLCGLGHRLGDLRVPTVEHRYHSRVWLSSMVFTGVVSRNIYYDIVANSIWAGFPISLIFLEWVMTLPMGFDRCSLSSEVNSSLGLNISRWLLCLKSISTKNKTSKLIWKCPSSAVKCWNLFIFSPFVPIVQDKKIKKHRAGPKSMRFSYLSFACGFVLPQGRGRSDGRVRVVSALATHVTTPWLKAEVYSDMCYIVYGNLVYLIYVYIYIYIIHKPFVTI